MWYAYILQSQKDREFYAGSTGDLKNRFKQHLQGFVTSTKHRRPLKLVYYEAMLNKKRAEERERYFKTSWGKRFIKKQLS